MSDVDKRLTRLEQRHPAPCTAPDLFGEAERIAALLRTLPRDQWEAVAALEGAAAGHAWHARAGCGG